MTRKPFYKRLLFSFQRPGKASPSPLRQESKNIETELLCQLFICELFDFFRPICRRHLQCLPNKRAVFIPIKRRPVKALCAFFSSPFSSATRGEFNKDGAKSQGFSSGFSKKIFSSHNILILIKKQHVKIAFFGHDKLLSAGVHTAVRDCPGAEGPTFWGQPCATCGYRFCSGNGSRKSRPCNQRAQRACPGKEFIVTGTIEWRRVIPL